MSWAKKARQALSKGQPATLILRDDSLSPHYEEGSSVRIEPVDAGRLKVGDLVLYRTKGRDYLHPVIARRVGRFLLGSSKNNWVKSQAIYGKVVVDG